MPELSHHSASHPLPGNPNQSGATGPNKRLPTRSSSHPSSTPSKGKLSLIPSISSRWLVSDDEQLIHDPMHTKLQDTFSHIQPAGGCESDIGLGTLPSPFDTDDEISPTTSDGPLTTMHSEYDWSTFINAYANGQWDPHRTPTPPRSCQPSTSGFSLSSDVPGPSTIIHDADVPVRSRPDVIHMHSDPQHIPHHSLTGAGPLRPPPAPPRSTTSTISISPSNSLRRFRPAAPPNLPMPPHRMRSSFSTCSAPLPSPGEAVNTAPSNTQLNSEAQTTAATLRWAAARVDISPLALPSPEHELTDPMRGYMAALPGAHSGGGGGGGDVGSVHPATPGVTRKPRLGSFWQGTIDVEDNPLQENLLLASSHSDTVPELNVTKCSPIQRTRPVSFPTTLFESPEHLAAASVPVPKANGDAESPSNDYFGHTVAQGDCPSGVCNGEAHSVVDSTFTPNSDSGSSLVPALPRRVCLTRQTSSPLPEASPREPKLIGGRVASESITSIRANRAAKEEQMFNDLGYLAPPNPPDELERRRALYKFVHFRLRLGSVDAKHQFRFNIWNTGPDLNFDRIAHLAKLVFNAKGVVISLIDGNEQWYKSEWGIQATTFARAHSICAHAILHRGDEPMIVLDTHKDWRFAKNPSVTGAPHIRFYAGAPLRTADGFNIGALAVISDTPREDFSPRQKHTLKEFAAIAMREMELWRDKIQLRIRDRIQNSKYALYQMEQFSRECLEIDTEQYHEAPGPKGLISGSSMDKVYDRASKLVKRTLDVEGVIVMDVSHYEVLESMNAEGTVSVNMHFGDPNMQATRRQLSAEEYQQLTAFFAKYPDGKISEGIVPPSFRPFLPTHIQYALSGLDVLVSRWGGILAAAELLGDSQLTHSQLSFLQTVQACGTSLVETVNHVLDFTKLSGNSKAGGVENVINPSKVDLIQLVEEAVDGSWIGYRARSAIVGDSAIGSVYSPPKDSSGVSMPPRSSASVETVIDIGLRREHGFVHVMLRELPLSDTDPADKVKVELSVVDTGKGISQNFLKRLGKGENPLQTGTGLGLAIVNSIVTSESVGGKVDVWSEEGSGTEIKVTFFAEKVEEPVQTPIMEPFKQEDSVKLPIVSLVGFDEPREGTQLLKKVLQSMLSTWWGLKMRPGSDDGDIVIVNEDVSLILEATRMRDISRSFIIITSSRGSATVMDAAANHELIGGFCRTLFKPYGPIRLRGLLRLCLHAHQIKMVPKPAATPQPNRVVPLPPPMEERERNVSGSSTFPRRRSDETQYKGPTKPPMAVRSTSVLALSSAWKGGNERQDREGSGDAEKTISVGPGGSLLRSSIGVPRSPERRFRVLVVEDNSILRNLLIKWLSQKGYDFCSAVDGRDGVNTFEKQSPFDVVLLDLSMPNLDGVAATAEIRAIESKRASAEDATAQASSTVRILALTGMSSLEDKRRAFQAGVDGYLVKPVAFKTLDEMFHKMGIV
ncbi:hypothetical protein H0H92_009449 [Tricholoma furcatifolium]|nr:hypothetical protein H0H92_009449 [Tricholoma furcatifolium]